MVKFTWFKGLLPGHLPVKQVYGIAFSDDKRVVLRIEDGKYKLTGGKPESAENFEETLKREYIEELNIELEEKEALLKVFAYPSESGTRVLFITHHLLCDGRGLLQLVQEFADHYASGARPHPVDDKLMESLNDLPSGSDLGVISKVIIKDANKKWRKEGHKE